MKPAPAQLRASRLPERGIAHTLAGMGIGFVLCSLGFLLRDWHLTVVGQAGIVIFVLCTAGLAVCCVWWLLARASDRLRR